jgi:formylglycine-generating enzyme required for sulfatase activity
MEGKISGPFVICPNIAFRTITNSIGMKLVLIPPGEFMMGSSESPEELAAAFAPYGAKVRDFQSGGRALEDKYQSKSIDVLNRSRGLLTPEQQRALDEATNKAVKAARAAGKEVDALSIVLDSLESITLTSDQEDSVGASLKELRQLAKERDEARAKLPSVIPWHRVQITKSYCIGAYEVTVGQFRRFVRETGYRTEAETDGRGGMGYDWATDKYEPKNIYNWKNPGYEQTDRHPVVNMSWNDANAFCRWLSKKENREYRLPTEAEWEYACRAGTETRFYNGNDPERVAEVGNVADASLKAKAAKWKGCMRASDGYPCAAPVGSFKPNAWGLYDMHGNAREWCADWYGEDYYRTCSGQDPKGPASGSKRIIRGGSWWLGPQWAFSAWRLMEPPEDCCDCLGFRVVRTP